MPPQPSATRHLSGAWRAKVRIPPERGRAPRLAVRRVDVDPDGPRSTANRTCEGEDFGQPQDVCHQQEHEDEDEGTQHIRRASRGTLQLVRQGKHFFVVEAMDARLHVFWVHSLVQQGLAKIFALQRLRDRHASLVRRFSRDRLFLRRCLSADGRGLGAGPHAGRQDRGSHDSGSDAFETAHEELQWNHEINRYTSPVVNFDEVGLLMDFGMSMRRGAVIVCTTVVSVALVGCGTTPGGQNQPSEGGMFGCKGLPNSQAKNTAIGAVAGAAIGALVGNQVANKRGVGTRNGALFGALAGALVGSQYKASISLTEMPDGSVKMNIPGSLLFETGESDIKPAFKQTLDQVAKSLREYCGLSARVVGHTDDVGSDASNDQLSLARARSVVSYLQSTGVRASNLSFEGRGEREPAASNETPEGRAQNRRVEIFVTEND